MDDQIRWYVKRHGAAKKTASSVDRRRGNNSAVDDTIRTERDGSQVGVKKQNIEVREKVVGPNIKSTHEAGAAAARGNIPEEIDKLDLIRKLIEQLKANINCNEVLHIFERILDLNDDKSSEKELKFQLLKELLNCIEMSDADDIKELLKLCRGLSLPESLKKLIVNEASIKIGRLLGQGSFGTVHLGELCKSDGQTVTVAVKSALNITYNKLITEEAKIMALLDHENIMKILAYQKDSPRIVTEYMEWGNLIEAIQRHDFSKTDILQVLFEVSAGMEYMSRKNCIHRDLACRNVFVNSNRRCKIGDFGISVFVDDTDGAYEDKEHFIAMYNTAPEAKLTQRFTTKSDVWSMGLLIWELYFRMLRMQTARFMWGVDIFTLMTSLHIALSSRMLPRSNWCPKQLFQYIMSELLNDNPNRRPTFTAIKHKISEILPLAELNNEDEEDDDEIFFLPHIF